MAAIKASAWADLPDAVTGIGQIPSDKVAIATILAGLVFAGAGGANNLVQSNWIRDKGYGMGAYIPKIVSPVTGEDQAAPSTGTMVRQDEENIARFKGWFRQASKEQLVSFWAICVGSIVIFSVLAYSTIFGKNISEAADFDFIKGEGEVLKDVVGSWFGTFFWIFGSLSLALVALGVVDYVSRLVADVVKTLYTPDSEKWTESRIYFSIVWSMVAIGVLVLLMGFDQPLVLLVLSACLNGMVMFIYSILLIRLNRRSLPAAIRVTGFRLGTLFFAVAFYGFFAGWLIIVQTRGAVLSGTPAVRPLRGLRGHVRRALRSGSGARAPVQLGARAPGRRRSGGAPSVVLTGRRPLMLVHPGVDGEGRTCAAANPDGWPVAISWPSSYWAVRSLR